MGDESKKWLLTVTAKGPTNMSVIKYWGKRDEDLILPLHDTLSVTFDIDHVCTVTTVAVSPRFDRDRLWLNGKEHSLDNSRYQNVLRAVRASAGDVEDKKKGVKITKKDWQNLHLHIGSVNNFPTAAGLASSAAGFATLVFALGKLMNVEGDKRKLSAIARLGSGSACRGLYGGFAKWFMGQNADGSDSYAVQIHNEKHWEDLVIIVPVVSSQQKEVSSAKGGLVTVQTSPFMHYRAKEVVPKRVAEMEEAIKNRDFATFARIACAENNSFHAVCLDTAPPLFYMNDTSHRLINCVEKWNRFEGTPQAAYTCDAGPNVVLFARNRKAAGLLIQRLFYLFPPRSDTDLNSFVLGDKSMLQEAMIQGIKDLQALPTPPEYNINPAKRYPGGIEKIFCTRPGRGPEYLTDDQALLNPETGYPK